MNRWRLLLLLAVLATGGAAGAAPGAAELLRAGAFAEAYAAARTSGDLVAASTAAAALAGRSSEAALWRSRAVESARAAVAANPAGAEAHLALGSALGLQARAGGFTLATLRTAQQARAALERALELDPTLHLARAVLAHWHAAAWARAGVLSGGRRDLAGTLALEAARAAPRELRVQVEAGLSLLALGQRDRGEPLLRAALALPPQGALDTLALVEARAALQTR